MVRPGLYAAALGLFVAAMLSKSVAVTLPVALVVILWWKQGRVTWPDAWRIAPFFLVALSISLVDLHHYQSSREFAFEYGFAERLLIAARALWFYVGKLVWPTDLAVIYPLWDVGTEDLLAWSFLVAGTAVVALLWFCRNRLGRGPLAGAAFFGVTLAPALGFVDYGFMSLSPVADRYAYLAGIGVMAALVGAAAGNVDRLPNLLRIGVSCVLFVVLAVLGKVTWDQAGIYRDKLSFYTHIISLNPDALMYANLAKAQKDAGRFEDALAASRIALKQTPDSADAHNTRGIALLNLDRLDEAGGEFPTRPGSSPGQ